MKQLLITSLCLLSTVANFAFGARISTLPASAASDCTGEIPQVAHWDYFEKVQRRMKSLEEGSQQFASCRKELQLLIENMRGRLRQNLPSPLPDSSSRPEIVESHEEQVRRRKEEALREFERHQKNMTEKELLEHCRKLYPEKPPYCPQ